MLSLGVQNFAKEKIQRKLFFYFDYKELPHSTIPFVNNIPYCKSRICYREKYVVHVVVGVSNNDGNRLKQCHAFETRRLYIPVIYITFK